MTDSIGRKRYVLSMGCFLLLGLILLSSCHGDGADPPQSPPNPEGSKAVDSQAPSESGEAQEGGVETQGAVGRKPLDWPEITENGVDEELFLKNMDVEVLETVAAEFQALVEEEAREEEENPEIVLTEGWVRVFQSERYQKVLDMGEPAMKPLYWIIYKSPSAGMYEYLCAEALYQLSGYDFTGEKGSGARTWTNSKELVERFNEQMLADRNR